MKLLDHARILVRTCGATQPSEKLLIIFDDSTRSIEPYLREAGLEATRAVKSIFMPLAGMHGVEPPEVVVAGMQWADVIVAATKYSLAHTDARFRATERGARYLSLPDYGEEQLARTSLEVDFAAHAGVGKHMRQMLDAGSTVRITTKKGTDLNLDITGRAANWAPGYCDRPGMLGSPPDIETNIAPLETESSGVLIVDGSIPYPKLGLLKEELRVEIEKGAIVRIGNTIEGAIVEALLDEVADPKRRILAEFGIGLNPKAELCGLMLEDEGCLGTVHFGFGSNATIGGANKTGFHLDMVIRAPSVWIDGTLVIEEGQIV